MCTCVYNATYWYVCMYVCLCMNECIYMKESWASVFHVHDSQSPQNNLNMYTQTHTYSIPCSEREKRHSYIRIYIYIYIYIYIIIDVYVRVCVCVSARVCICVCTYNAKPALSAHPPWTIRGSCSREARTIAFCWYFSPEAVCLGLGSHWEALWCGPTHSAHCY